MGINKEKQMQFNDAMEIAKDLEYIINDSAGEEVCFVSSEEGNEKHTSSLIFVDVVSFTSLHTLSMQGFTELINYADGVTFLNSGDFVRIVLSFVDAYSNELVTAIKEFKKPRAKE